jgi:hypothetical protein
MLNKSSLPLASQKGMAVVELIPTLIVFMLLINFSLGLFGSIHTGILNNIAARNYFFETLRHRPNVGYHRDFDSRASRFHQRGYRFSGIVKENAPDNNGWYATARPVAFTSGFGGTSSEMGTSLAERGPANEPDAANRHNRDVPQLDENVRNERVGVAQIWLKQIYGICLNSRCGD